MKIENEAAYAVTLTMFCIYIYTNTYNVKNVDKEHIGNNLYLQSRINNLIDLVALSVEGNVDGGNGEFVFVDGSNWELVLMDGSDGQMVTLWLETGLIGSPGQSEFLAFRGNPVGRSLVGVAHNILVCGFTVGVVLDSLHLLLDLGFLAGGVVRLGVAVLHNQAFAK
jgi:hypothetical protein